MIAKRKIKLYTRIKHGHTDDWILRPVDLGCDDVPVSVFKSFNKVFYRRFLETGRLWPADEFAIYNGAVYEIISTAKHPPELRSATLETYLIGVGIKSVLSQISKLVRPLRAEYRALCNTGRVEVDNVDTDNERADNEWRPRNMTTLDVEAFVESLPGTHSATRAEVARLAASVVYKTLTSLSADAQRGLRAFIKADGVWTDAAIFYGASRQGYHYRFLHHWAPEFRKHCNFVW